MADDWYSQFSANSDWKDPVYGENQWQAWKNEQNAKGGPQAGCPPNLPFTGRNGQCAAKPDDCPDGMHVEGTPGTCVPDGQGAQAGGGFGGGNFGTGTGGFGGGGFTGGGSAGWYGSGPGGWGQAAPGGGLPGFNWNQFQAPNLSEDPGYQFRLDQGVKAIDQSAAAKGTLRSGGTLKDIMGYGQDLASQEYGNAFNRALQGWGANFQGAQAQYQPVYGAWQTGQNAALSKYLNRENNIASLLTSMPAPNIPVMA